MANAKAELPLTYDTHLAQVGGGGVSGDQISDATATSSHVRQVRRPLCSEAEAKGVESGPEDTIRLSRELSLVVLVADVDCSCFPGVGSHCATASGWRGFMFGDRLDAQEIRL